MLDDLTKAGMNQTDLEAVVQIIKDSHMSVLDGTARLQRMGRVTVFATALWHAFQNVFDEYGVRGNGEDHNLDIFINECIEDLCKAYIVPPSHQLHPI
jgi:hypothetical protein